MATPFKDLIDSALVARYAQGLAAVPGFDSNTFEAAVLPALPALELKDRVRCVADAVAAQLGDDPPRALAALLALAGPPAALNVPNSGDFGLWPATMFVQRHALACPAESMAALHALTQRFTSEWAIRPFLVHYPDRTWAALSTWTADPSPHVRRLCSEGTRPRLPWGPKLDASVRDPERGLALLDRLHLDPHPYVRRSVANHVGDVAKDHLDLAVARLERWKAAAPPARQADTAWLVRHALRHPIKQGCPAALRCIGLDPALPIHLTALRCSPEVRLGEALTIEAEVACDIAGTAEIDLLVHFVKADGSRRPKAFKGWRIALEPGVPQVLARRLPLRDVTTRRHFTGVHRVEVQANGRSPGGADFVLRLAGAEPEDDGPAPGPARSQA